MIKKHKARSIFDIIRKLFKKYQKDHGNIIVSSISFYVLLTFIPFTLLSIFILGHVIDLSNPGLHLEKFLKSIVPDPYNTMIAKKVLKELNFISLSKKLSGPLGLLFLFFFTTRLFAIIRPSFQIIFGKDTKSFMRGKGEELLLTFLFSLVQALLFFSFIFSIMVQTKVEWCPTCILNEGPLHFTLFLARHGLDLRYVFSSLLFSHSSSKPEAYSHFNHPGNVFLVYRAVSLQVLYPAHRKGDRFFRNIRRLYRLPLLDLLLGFCLYCLC